MTISVTIHTNDKAAKVVLVDRLRNMGSSLDQRHVALAVTHGEDAFMRAVRAIAQPERIVA